MVYSLKSCIKGSAPRRIVSLCFTPLVRSLMLTGILLSASHLRVEPSGRVRIPVVPTVKTKTRHETVFLFLFWRAQKDSNPQPSDP